nr:unnamed protein product [Digitaria exilis]
MSVFLRLQYPTSIAPRTARKESAAAAQNRCEGRRPRASRSRGAWDQTRQPASPALPPNGAARDRLLRPRRRSAAVRGLCPPSHVLAPPPRGLRVLAYRPGSPSYATRRDFVGAPEGRKWKRRDDGCEAKGLGREGKVFAMRERDGAWGFRPGAA